MKKGKSWKTLPERGGIAHCVAPVNPFSAEVAI
jgi:hypothetical protein